MVIIRHPLWKEFLQYQHMENILQKKWICRMQIMYSKECCLMKFFLITRNCLKQNLECYTPSRQPCVSYKGEARKIK